MNQAATRKAQTYSPHLEYLRFLRETIHARAKPFSIIIFTQRLNSISYEYFYFRKNTQREKKASVS